METQDTIDLDLAFEPLRLSSLKRCANQAEFDLVLQAYRFAKEAHKGQKRLSGQPIILHCIAVALIVVDEIGLGYKSIIAALLHHILTDTDFSKEEIAAAYGNKVAELVDGLGRLEKVFATQDKTQAETFRQMLLTVNNDARVLLIKLADRLHNLRCMDELPVEKQARNLGESRYVFVPLAHRLGLYSIKSEMEDIWMCHAMPVEYKEIATLVQKEMDTRGADITRLFIEPIEQLLRQENLQFTISTRIKKPYSIWRKMQKRGTPFDKVYDLFAVRIVFEPQEQDIEQERLECYHIEQLLNQVWTPNPERRRDWITDPKETGYEALHSTYLSPKGNWIEVQIRSRRMDDIAERGVAAHWKYKGITMEPSEMERWLSTVRQTLEDKDLDALTYFDSFQVGQLAPELYIFTPKGEMRTLPKGATALDFAYSIHTEVGNRALAAKVNNQLVLLSQTLQGGDQVEIITTENPQPKIEWLSFVKTSKAYDMILDALDLRLNSFTGKGRKILQEELSKYGIPLHANVVEKLQTAYNTNSKDELYGKIGAGILKLDHLQTILLSGRNQKTVNGLVPRPMGRRKKEVIDTRLATCCHPLEGDEIVGFLDKKGTLVIHSINCKKAKALARLHKDDNAMMAVTWERKRIPVFLTKIVLRGNDHMGVVWDIARTISLVMRVNMRRINILAHDSIFDGEIEVYVQNKKDLQTLLAQLEALNGIESVKVEKDINE